MLLDDLAQPAPLSHNSEHFEILIVDSDSEATEQLIKTALRPRGYSVQIARTGREALSRIRRVVPDLIMLDWHLPDMQGSELLQTLIDSGRRFPSIVMGAAGSEQIIVQSFRLGARDYLGKPLDTEETIQAIRRALTTRWGQRQRAQQIEALRQQLQRWIALLEMCRSIFSILRPDALLTQLVDAAILVTGAEEGFVLLAHPETDSLELRALRGLDEEKTKLVRLAIGDSSASLVYESGNPLRLGSNDPAQHKVKTGYLAKALIHVPIKLGQKVIGVLSVDRKLSTQPFCSEDEALLVQLAECAAVALENIGRFRDAQQAHKQLSETAQSQLAHCRQQIDQLSTSLTEPNGNQQALVTQILDEMESVSTLLLPGNGRHG